MTKATSVRSTRSLRERLQAAEVERDQLRADLGALKTLYRAENKSLTDAVKRYQGLLGAIVYQYGKKGEMLVKPSSIAKIGDYGGISIEKVGRGGSTKLTLHELEEATS